MLETLSNLFYDPFVFWGVPLIFALAREAARNRLPGGRGAD